MKFRLLSFLAALSLLTVAVHAETAADIRRRLEQRLPSIDALKAQEAVGENNRGLLEKPPAGKAGGEDVVAAENADRLAVYALIAKETGATPDAVGRARAKKIAANSNAGVWVQDESGQWKKR